MKKTYSNSTLLFYSFALLVTTAIIFLAFVEVDRVVSGRGKTVLLEPKIIIRPVTSSTIKSIHVQVGDSVKKGQTIIVLDPTVAESEVTKHNEKVVSYQNELTRLEQTLLPKGASANTTVLTDDTQAQMLKAERAQFQEKLKSMREAEKSLSAKVTDLQTQLPMLKEQVRIAVQLESMWDELVNQENYGSKLNWYKATQDRIRSDTQHSQTEGELKKTLHDLAKATAESESFIKEWTVKKTDERIKAERFYRESRQDANRAGFEGNAVTINAPDDGIVVEMSDNAVGTLVSQSDVLLKIVPAKIPKYVDIRVAATDISYVSQGMPVDIKLDTAPFQKHGDLRGYVKSLSYDSFDTKIDGSGQSSREISTNVSKTSQDSEQFYLARVEITENKLHSLPDSFRLLPGMTLTGDVKIGTRKLYEYILFPLMRALKEGAREP